MKRIVKYMVISSYDEHNFHDEVNKMIAEKWQPFGSLIAPSDQEGCFYYCQTVVLYEGDDFK